MNLYQLAELLLPLEVRVGWQDQAACVGMDPRLFFSEGENYSGAARAACDSCPVAYECIKVELGETISYGLRGGTTPKDRKDLRATMNRMKAANRA